MSGLWQCGRNGAEFRGFTLEGLCQGLDVYLLVNGQRCLRWHSQELTPRVPILMERDIGSSKSGMVWPTLRGFLHIKSLTSARELLRIKGILLSISIEPWLSVS